jgi:long-chain fatty acid transport protein
MPTGAARAQFGAVMAATGAVDRSMGGAATAAPLSPTGALYWNPATISGFARSELEFGAEVLIPHARLVSSVNPGTLAPGFPPVGVAGQQDSETGVFSLPSIGLVYRPEDSRLSFGLGLFAVAGFGVNYAGSTTNPLTTAPLPVGIGFGPIHSDYEVLQIAPAVSWQITERLSIAAGPTIDVGRLQVAPALFAAPDDADGDRFFTYPQANHYMTAWGGGFNVGAYFKEETWAVGASFKSPQWFDTYRFNGTDELGRPRSFNFNLNLPLIVSAGASYSGFERWLLAADVRYLDYANTHGWGPEGFAPDGSLRGLDWRSIVAVATGAQYQLTDCLSLRLGYSWNENPIRDSQSAINAVAPVILEHTLSAGASWRVTSDFTLSVAYVHGFQNSIEGPLVTPAGPIAGTFVRNTASADLIMFGGSVRFGGAARSEVVRTSPE